MQMSMPSRKTVITQLVALIESKISKNKLLIADLKESREADARTSAGDKYETGVEMMQQDIEQAQERIDLLRKQLDEVHRAKSQNSSDVITFGNLVRTNHGLFFLAVGMGELKMEGQTCFCISMESPLGKAFFGKKEGEEVTVNERVHEIMEVL